MAEYQHHPEPTYGIEIRDGWTEDDYIAQARGFSSTAEFRQYRDAPQERREEMREARESRDNNGADDSDEDLGRYAELLKVSNE
jgi:hypothetical protein